MKKLLALTALLWAAGAAGYYYWNDARGQRVKYRTVVARKGDLRAAVHATGTIEPEEVVDVGAQVAGEILSFGEDPARRDKTISFGTPVEKGTVLARLDDALFRARVDQARAKLRQAESDVEQCRAKSRQAEREFDRSQKLRAKGTGMIAAQEADAAQAGYEIAKAALGVAEANAAVAQANLDEANTNLGYTTIRSPVKGVILDRRVNIGQTVVASLNAPSLFLIAKDLARLEIWASVNETDVGSIHPGQAVRFSVGAFPGETFEGKVAQTRLNASMVQNVVTYTVAVSVDNASRKLLPYLTARVDFEVETRRDVLLVPRAALRWQPKPEHVSPEARAAYAGALVAKAKGDAASKDGEATLWVVVGDFVRPLKVKAGLSDGVRTEVRADGLEEGREFVIGVERRDDDIASFLPHTRSADKPAEADGSNKSDR